MSKNQSSICEHSYQLQRKGGLYDMAAVFIINGIFRKATPSVCGIQLVAVENE